LPLNVISAHQLIADFNELRPNKKIAKKYNVSAPTVHRALTLLNIDYHVKRDLSKDFPTDVVKELYYELKSIRAISRKYNLDRTHIKKMLAAA
jgi:transposase